MREHRYIDPLDLRLPAWLEGCKKEVKGKGLSQGWRKDELTLQPRRPEPAVVKPAALGITQL